MTGWRHVVRLLGTCVVEVDDWSGATGLCGCTEPTPDPASPCGFEDCPRPMCAYQPDRYWHAVAAPLAVPTSLHHPHQPTRCLRCGHGIEVAG